MAPRETENNAWQNFGVTNKEHYGMLWYFPEVFNWQSNPADRTGFYNHHHHHHHRHHYNGILAFQQQLVLLRLKKKLSKQVQYNGKCKFKIDLNLTIS